MRGLMRTTINKKKILIKYTTYFALVNNASTTPGSALDHARHRKLTQSCDPCRWEGVVFIPLPAETCHPEAAKELSHLARTLVRHTSKDDAPFLPTPSDRPHSVGCGACGTCDHLLLNCTFNG